MSWPPSPSLPAAIAQFLAAPLPPSPPAPFCVTPAHGGTATLRDMSEPEYMHGVPTGACREEPPDAKLQARAHALDITAIEAIKGKGWRGQNDRQLACQVMERNGGIWGPTQPK